jgi:hypothetical protein
VLHKHMMLRPPAGMTQQQPYTRRHPTIRETHACKIIGAMGSGSPTSSTAAVSSVIRRRLSKKPGCASASHERRSASAGSRSLAVTTRAALIVARTCWTATASVILACATDTAPDPSRHPLGRAIATLRVPSRWDVHKSKDQQYEELGGLAALWRWGQARQLPRQCHQVTSPDHRAFGTPGDGKSTSVCNAA